MGIHGDVMVERLRSEVEEGAQIARVRDKGAATQG